MPDIKTIIVTHWKLNTNNLQLAPVPNARTGAITRNAGQSRLLTEQQLRNSYCSINDKLVVFDTPRFPLRRTLKGPAQPAAVASGALNMSRHSYCCGAFNGYF